MYHVRKTPAPARSFLIEATRRRVQRARLGQQINSETAGSAPGQVGFVVASVPKKRGERKQLAIGVTETRGGILHDPAKGISYRIRAALTSKPIARVTIYDAAGKPIATMNPVTRERTPL